MHRRVGDYRRRGVHVRPGCILLALIRQEGVGFRRGRRDGHRGEALSLAVSRLARLHHRQLFAIQRRKDGEALLRRGCHERNFVRLLACFIHLAHAVAERPLLSVAVAVGDHEGHEGARFRRLCAGCLGLGQNGVGDLVEERDVAGGKGSGNALDGYARLLTCGEQPSAADERNTAQHGAHAANRLAAGDQILVH